MSDNGGAKFSYFLVGLGIGTVIGLLFAPRSGRETRDLLNEKVDEGREFLKRRSRELREQAEDVVERGKETVAKQKDQLSAAIEAGKQAYREEKKTH
jgi:gas vesicle protein